MEWSSLPNTPPSPLDAIRLGGMDQLFFEGLDELQKDLPAQTEMKVPESPLIKVTALTVDENGKIIPCDALRRS